MNSDVKNATFKCYIEEGEFESISLNDTQKTKLLNGETLVFETPLVYMLTPFNSAREKVLGVLSVTTFKLSFAYLNSNDQSSAYIRNSYLLGQNEICLSLIDSIYQITDGSRKKLQPGRNVTTKIKQLLVVCKNMRLMEFNFENGERDSGKTVANALLHHAFPKKHHLLFAYEHREPPPSHKVKEVRWFKSPDYWSREITRTKCKNWRVSDVNQHFHISQHLPQYFVVPKSILDVNIENSVGVFKNEGIPIWVWGSEDVALVRMSELLPTVTDNTKENFLLMHVHKSHPERIPPIIIELGKECPSLSDLQHSFTKLKELCMPENYKTFKIQDSKFYGLLDNSRWLQYISTILNLATRVADHITSGYSVVLQEDKGQDLNCVISSLAQLLLDSHWRSRRGFQTLIQKEWIVLAHPFANRLGHVFDGDYNPAPVFLIFLDCVWQLLQQFPNAFQFSDTFLITMWDSAHICLFDTFLFNSEYDRQVATRGPNPITLNSVWNWQEQFNDNDLVLFNNPLYDKQFKERLIPNTRIASLDVWRQCYFRWIPGLEIKAGGRPQIDLCNRIIAERIDYLRHVIFAATNSMTNNHRMEDNIDDTTTDVSQIKDVLKNVGSFYPFVQNDFQLSPIDHDLLTSDDTQSVLNFAND